MILCDPKLQFKNCKKKQWSSSRQTQFVCFFLGGRFSQNISNLQKMESEQNTKIVKWHFQSQQYELLVPFTVFTHVRLCHGFWHFVLVSQETVGSPQVVYTEYERTRSYGCSSTESHPAQIYVTFNTSCKQNVVVHNTLSKYLCVKFSHIINRLSTC